LKYRERECNEIHRTITPLKWSSCHSSSNWITFSSQFSPSNSSKFHLPLLSILYWKSSLRTNVPVPFPTICIFFIPTPISFLSSQVQLPLIRRSLSIPTRCTSTLLCKFLSNPDKFPFALLSVHLSIPHEFHFHSSLNITFHCKHFSLIQVPVIFPPFPSYPSLKSQFPFPLFYANCLALLGPVREIGSIYPTADYRGNRLSKTLY
jgi:hypothetical protein